MVVVSGFVPYARAFEASVCPDPADYSLDDDGADDGAAIG